MQVFIIQKDDLREKYRLLAVFFALPFPSDIQHLYRRHLCKTLCPNTGCDCDERVISPAARHCIKLVFPTLETLFKLALHISDRHLFRLLPFNSETDVFFYCGLICFLSIRCKDLINFRNRKPAILLTRRAEYDIPDHIKSHIQRLGLIVPDIPHLESAGKHIFDIKETAVHRIPARRHIMDIDITVPARLDLLCRQEKFLIQLFVKLVEDQTPLR